MSDARIPKIAHYIWIGDGEQNELIRRCIASFHEKLPDYEIICWDNDRSRVVFDNYSYAREAYEQGMFAFASDVIRLHALKEYGGIYLDADVELLRPLDPFLHHSFFTGFEGGESAVTAVMGSEKNGRLVSSLLDAYKSRHFNVAGRPDFTTNTKVIHEALVREGIVVEDRDQILEDGTAVYRSEIFCPYDPRSGGGPTDSSYAIHHFNGSWAVFKRKENRKARIKRRALRALAVVLSVGVLWSLYTGMK